MYAHPAVVCHIKTLFNAFVSHAYSLGSWLYNQLYNRLYSVNGRLEGWRSVVSASFIQWCTNRLIYRSFKQNSYTSSKRLDKNTHHRIIDIARIVCV